MINENSTSAECLMTSPSLFKPANWLATIDFIKQFILSNNALVNVLAEPCGGKTSFVALLTEEMDVATQTHSHQVSSSFSNDDLIAELGAIFHINIDSSTTIIDMVEHINQAGKPFLLVLDDAQNLPSAFLQDILRHIKGCENNIFFHVCLVADKTILEPLHTLESEQFDTLIHTIELGGLTEQETSTWLLNKSNGAFHIDNRRLNEFYQLTGGNVALITSHMAAFAENASSAALPKRKKPVLLRLVQAVSIIFVLSVITWFWQTNDYSLPLQKIEVSVAEPIKSVQPTFEAPLKSRIPAAYSMASTVQIMEPSPRNLVIDYVESDEISLQKMVVLDKVVVLPNIAFARHVPEVVLVSVIPDIGVLASKKAVPEIKVAKKDSALYTIQLLASKQRNELEKFIADHHARGPFKIGYIKRNGAGWYVLTMGEFEKSKLAERARDALPRDITHFKPWVRSAKDLVDIG